LLCLWSRLQHAPMLATSEPEAKRSLEGAGVFGAAPNLC
jgi:hypothetical protein